MWQFTWTVSNIVSLGIAGSLAAAETLFVPGDFPTIQAAIDAAVDGDVVQLEGGVYNEVAIIQDKSVSLIGAGPDSTVIDGSNIAPATLLRIHSTDPRNAPSVTVAGIRFFHGEGTSPNIVDILPPDFGLTIETVGGGIAATDVILIVEDCVFERNFAGVGGGIAGRDVLLTCRDSVFVDNDPTLEPGSPSVRVGAGMALFNSSITCTECIFDANLAAAAAGAMYVDESSVDIVGSTFSNNYGSSSGGAVYARDSVVTATDCLFDRNSNFFANGGAVLLDGKQSQGSFHSCVFQFNGRQPGGFNPGLGGAVFLEGPATFVGCVFDDNKADSAGAIYAQADLTAINCTFRDNRAFPDFTGAIAAAPFPLGSTSVMTIDRCLFDGNSAAQSVGGVSAPETVSGSITRSTFVGTVVDDFNNGGSLFINGDINVLHCIFWNNQGPQLNLSGDATIEYSNIEGGFVGPAAGRGNIDADPLFVDPKNGNFNLQPGSPCIDAGLNGADMGAFPFNDAGSLGDLNNDTVVNGADLLILLNAWGQSGPTDLDMSGTTSGSDLLILLNNWG